MVIGGDRDNLGVCHSDLRIERRKIQMLLMFFRAVVAARKRQDQGIATLEFAEPTLRTCMVGQLKIGKYISCNQIVRHRSNPLKDTAELTLQLVGIGIR